MPGLGVQSLEKGLKDLVTGPSGVAKVLEVLYFDVHVKPLGIFI